MRVRWNLVTLPVLLGAMFSPLHAHDAIASRVRIDRVVIIKSRHELQLISQNRAVKTYKVSLGPNTVGHKQCEGDGRTPEGAYAISGRNAKSRFHRSLWISYPNEQDRANAVKHGCSAGGDIMIHGLPNGFGWLNRGHLIKDWTAGCVAVTNAEIEEIWEAVPDGTPVEIRP